MTHDNQMFVYFFERNFAEYSIIVMTLTNSMDCIAYSIDKCSIQYPKQVH